MILYPIGKDCLFIEEFVFYGFTRITIGEDGNRNDWQDG